MRKVTVLAALTGFVLGGAVAGRAETDFTGTTEGGAHYKITVPDGWEPADGLVIWNHGFSLGPVNTPDDVQESPFKSLHLENGFAVAASSYRQVGWALFKTTQDLKNLYREFVAQVGTPEKVYLTGASLGGIVTAQAIEKRVAGNVIGALTFCGAMAGSRNWDAALDLRLLYDHVCGKVPGAAIPGGPQGLPKNSGWTRGHVEAAVDTCTGVGLPKSARTPAQRRRLKQLKKFSKVPVDVEGVLQTDMWYVTFGMGDLAHDRGKLRGKQGIGNENVNYGNKKVNRKIERVTPKKKAARKLAKNYTPKGNVGDVKIVSLHTDGDPLVLVENQSEYAAVVPEENLQVAIVVEEEPSHCGFELAEIGAAWEALKSWAEGGTKPTVEAIQVACETAAALIGGECRFDPGYVVQDMDVRVRPRE